jgi:hypothetical protein
MHAQSLARFPFDSVLLPASRTLFQDLGYREEFESLRARCRDERVALQTIKAIARRRWPEGATGTYDTWYEPLDDPREIEREVRFVLSHADFFLNSAGDLRLLRPTLHAAAAFGSDGRSPEAQAWEGSELAPLWLRGFSRA